MGKGPLGVMGPQGKGPGGSRQELAQLLLICLDNIETFGPKMEDKKDGSSG